MAGLWAALLGSLCALPRGAAAEWPGCQEQNTVIRNAGQALFTNLQGYGATIGCFLDDCMSSDKFVASEIDSCAKVCFSLPECQHWVWGTEERASRSAGSGRGTLAGRPARAGCRGRRAATRRARR
ncbi:unnamed protein product [Prorocentrum cordatum]|uniref:Uncharacterized protein n=1 Tax=Prorocentrum cordatum TaxID=2364126 RepID=A0ABN9UBR7_9DINO|nr:unnamed protein product [Polarella glacialis]